MISVLRWFSLPCLFRLSGSLGRDGVKKDSPEAMLDTSFFQSWKCDAVSFSFSLVVTITVGRYFVQILRQNPQNKASLPVDEVMPASLIDFYFFCV